MKAIGYVVGALIVALVLLLQAMSIRSLRLELAQIRATMESSVPVDPGVAGQPRPAPASVGLGTLPQRVSQLELTVADLAKTSEVLVERGMVPPTSEHIAQLQQRFLDPTSPDGERLRAFRLLRRNGQLTDELAFQAMDWMQGSTNTNTRRELLRNLDGLTNAAMKGPLLAMLDTEGNGSVREELVDVLADFAGDAAIEEKMWQLAINDPSGDVREEAQEALTEGRMTPERLEALKQRAADPNRSLDERLLALRGLREGDANAPEVMLEMANLAQSSSDPVTRAKLFEAFDGMNDPSLMAPLVYGLQDANPVVRERAADALGSFSSDPRIQEWLNHVIVTDTDPRVKREAFQALEESQRRRGQGRGGRR